MNRFDFKLDDVYNLKQIKEFRTYSFQKDFLDNGGDYYDLTPFGFHEKLLLDYDEIRAYVNAEEFGL